MYGLLFRSIINTNRGVRENRCSLLADDLVRPRRLIFFASAREARLSTPWYLISEKEETNIKDCSGKQTKIMYVWSAKNLQRGICTGCKHWMKLMVSKDKNNVANFYDFLKSISKLKCTRIVGSATSFNCSIRIKDMKTLCIKNVKRNDIKYLINFIFKFHKIIKEKKHINYQCVLKRQ